MRIAGEAGAEGQQFAEHRMVTAGVPVGGDDCFGEGARRARIWPCCVHADATGRVRSEKDGRVGAGRPGEAVTNRLLTTFAVVGTDIVWLINSTMVTARPSCSPTPPSGIVSVQCSLAEESIL